MACRSCPVHDVTRRATLRRVGRAAANRFRGSEGGSIGLAAGLARDRFDSGSECSGLHCPNTSATDSPRFAAAPIREFAAIGSVNRIILFAANGRSTLCTENNGEYGLRGGACWRARPAARMADSAPRGPRHAFHHRLASHPQEPQRERPLPCPMFVRKIGVCRRKPSGGNGFLRVRGVGRGAPLAGFT